MENFEKVIEHIKAQSENECRDIAVKANEESARIRDAYSKKEQEAYWSFVNNGTKDIEKRIEKLAMFATEEARKMIRATEQDMLDEVLERTAHKLAALPTRKYNELLSKLGIERGCKPQYLVEHYREELADTVIDALFN